MAARHDGPPKGRSGTSSLRDGAAVEIWPGPLGPRHLLELGYSYIPMTV